jgi:hypothetical protein
MARQTSPSRTHRRARTAKTVRMTFGAAVYCMANHPLKLSSGNIQALIAFQGHSR